MPAISSPWLIPGTIFHQRLVSDIDMEIRDEPRSAIAQSLGFDPATTTLMIRWFALGMDGKSTSVIVTLGPGKMTASFISKMKY
jgi:predicted PP-loop superfamily ATPase